VIQYLLATTMDISLHPHQLEIFHDEHRYKVVAAGRRFGKSYLAAACLYVEAAKTEVTRSDGVTVDLTLEKVYYVAPTFTQGKEILWPVLKELGGSLIQQTYENEACVKLVNGRTIHIKGADKPDSLRGTGLSYVVLDEYAMMKPECWEMIIVPQLARSEGKALFIGTPDGKNHFYELWQQAKLEENPEWRAFTYHSKNNPFLPKAEMENLAKNMSAEKYRQEMEASFESGGGVIMTKDMFSYAESPPGDCYIACDLAGFQAVEGGRKVKKLDEHAIAIVINHAGGWHIKEIIHGQWDTRETALRLVKAYRDHRPNAFGIEKGMAMNAVMPYLNDEMNRLGTYFEVQPLTHGNQKKIDRITWALQGRAEKGRITLERGGKWVRHFLEQAVDFPSRLSHDDLLDAVAYIDQLATPYYDGEYVIDEWQPMDDIAGY